MIPSKHASEHSEHLHPSFGHPTQWNWIPWQLVPPKEKEETKERAKAWPKEKGKQKKDLAQTECYRCSHKGHLSKNVTVKLMPIDPSF